MEYRSAYVWLSGVRKENPDSLTLQQARIRGAEVLLAVVCDGGREESGEQRGESVGVAVEELTKWFYREGLSRLRRVFRGGLVSSMNRELFRLDCKQNGNRRGMGENTSLLAAVCCNRQCHIFYIGDCRAYLTGRKVKCLTKENPGGNGIGGMNRRKAGYRKAAFRKAAYRKIILHGDEALLLCTDGFYRRLTVQKAAELFGKGKEITEDKAERRLKQLCRKWQDEGETDSMTAVLIWRA